MSAERCIDYIEFPATDLSAVKQFYTAICGWTFEDYGPTYTSFSDGRIAGGFEQAERVTPGSPLVVLYTADLEARQAAVEAAGGTIVEPAFSFPGGRRFHFADPSGNVLAFWSDQ